ncbi:MAG: hypothetical protein KF773_32420 [Deltaproteobacteria bacterium]|nr:hypothetical protein [Deltaproteobacteria bacterium]
MSFEAAQRMTIIAVVDRGEITALMTAVIDRTARLRRLCRGERALHGGIFPNAACVTALIVRVVHHADVIGIEGDSYRRRDAETARRSRRAKP